jgi:hypothetical protein
MPTQTMATGGLELEFELAAAALSEAWVEAIMYGSRIVSELKQDVVSVCNYSPVTCLVTVSVDWCKGAW